MGKKDSGLMPKEVALSKATALCSGSEHCTSQIMEKLSLWNVSPQDAYDIMDYLVKEKYIDNSRFARAYCHDKFCYNHWGRIKISQMLRLLEMDSTDINEGLDAIPEEEYQEVLQHILEQKNKQLRDSDPYIRKGKLVRHALSRGFETHLILEATEALLHDS